jgi:phenylalanyl-tRNA synthetase beta chain
MIISYQWITELLGFAIPPREMMEKLVMLGHEIEEFVDLGLLDNPIRIARITKVEPHPATREPGAGPNVKNLTVCAVDDGGAEPVSVVCGAPNAAEGMVSVLARSGAKLPDGRILRKTKIRGVVSDGMLLAPDEMGLGTDHEGIIVLEPRAEVGKGYDLILHLKITPNRADCLSVLGLARDLAAAYGKKVYLPPVRVKETYENVMDWAKVTIRCGEDCPRYTGRIIHDVKAGPSPAWLQRRLLAVGLRPINNIVDATNLVLMELGHPIHAFDYDKLRNHEIIVRKAKQGENLFLIDETEIELAQEDMVIADAEVPVALAGVMGGADSAVSGETRNILLECALFKPTTIRRTARRHKMSTDASYRFERGVDPGGLPRALDRCAMLIAELGEGKIPHGILDVHCQRTAPLHLALRTARACRVLGIDLPKTIIADLVAAIGCEILRTEEELLVLSVPSHRGDITREEDIYEEIARLYGYDRIPSTLPNLPIQDRPPNATVRTRCLLQDLLVELGFRETIHTSFVGAAQMEELGLDSQSALKILNPISRELDLLRPDLAPSMLRTLVFNQNRGNTDLHLFEISKTFHFGDMATPTVEKPMVILASMGACSPGSWRGGAPQDADFHTMKGVLEVLFLKLGVGAFKVARGGPSFLQTGRSARLLLQTVRSAGFSPFPNVGGEVEVGWMGELGPVVRERLGLRGRPVLAELSLDALGPFISSARRFTEIPRYPTIERDLALVVDSGVPAGKAERIIESEAGELLESLFLFDCYTGEQIAAGKKSLGYRAVYRHPDRTLTDGEVDAIQQKILKALSEQVGAVLRD